MPDEDDEAAEVIVVVDQHLSVRAADTNTDGLRTEEVTLGDFSGRVVATTIERRGDVLGREVGGLEELHTFKLDASRHHRLTSQEVGLTSLRTHVEAGVVRHHGVAHVHALTRIASVTGDLAEVTVTTQVHHEGGIHDGAIQAISVSRNVTLTEVLNNSQQVSLDRELLGLGAVLIGGVGNATGGILGLATSEVVTTLRSRGGTVCFSFGQFVNEDAVTPTAIVVEQGQRTDALVEHVQVAGIQQETLSGHQGFTSNLEGAGLGCITRVRRTGVLLKHNKHLLLGDVAAVGGANGLVSNALTAVLGTRSTPELVAV